MPPKGGRANFASLVGAVGEHSPVDRKRTPPTPTKTKTTIEPLEGQLLADVPVDQLIANPRNPRDELGGPVGSGDHRRPATATGTVVSRTAWLKLWPEDEDEIGAAQYIVVNGNRRLAAAQKYGRPRTRRGAARQHRRRQGRNPLGSNK